MPALTSGVKTDSSILNLKAIDFKEVRSEVNSLLVNGEAIVAAFKTIRDQVVFTNKKYPEEDVDKSFSAYEDYDSTQSLDAVEAGLCESIIDKLCEDIFNATVAQW